MKLLEVKKVQGFAINLKHRTDRKEHIQNEIKKLPFVDLEVIEAIDDGTGTCFQSQKKCIELAKKRNLSHVLILEDDATFVDSALEHISSAFYQLESLNWNMFFLGANLQKPSYLVTGHLVRMEGAFAAHAYMVNSNFYDTILSLPHDREMDQHYHDLMHSNAVYLCNPMISYQLPSYSDLQNGYRDYNEAMKRNFKKFTR